MNRTTEPRLPDPSDLSQPLTPEQEREHKLASDRETKEWFRQKVRVTKADYVENRWLGILMVALLLAGGLASTGLVVFLVDRDGTTFWKDRFVPIAGINVPAWAMVWAVNRAFILPSWPLAAAVALTSGILVHDALISARPAVPLHAEKPPETPRSPEQAP